MKITREQARNMSGGGNVFFKLDEGKSAMVRFLYNTMEDMEPEACHNVQLPGIKYPQNVLCARADENSPIDDCIYCAHGSNIVPRYLIPMYNEDTQEIQYWVRTPKFEEKLSVHTEDFNGKAPISGQVFKIIRTGNEKSTDYELVRQGNNDGKTKDAFGPIKTNGELKMIKPANYQPPAQPENFGNNSFNGQNNRGAQQNNFGGQQFNSTRRTADMF